MHSLQCCCAQAQNYISRAFRKVMGLDFAIENEEKLISGQLYFSSLCIRAKRKKSKIFTGKLVKKSRSTYLRRIMLHSVRSNLNRRAAQKFYEQRQL